MLLPVSSPLLLVGPMLPSQFSSFPVFQFCMLLPVSSPLLLVGPIHQRCAHLCSPAIGCCWHCSPHCPRCDWLPLASSPLLLVGPIRQRCIHLCSPAIGCFLPRSPHCPCWGWQFRVRVRVRVRPQPCKLQLCPLPHHDSLLLPVGPIHQGCSHPCSPAIGCSLHRSTLHAPIMPPRSSDLLLAQWRCRHTMPIA